MQILYVFSFSIIIIIVIIITYFVITNNYTKNFDNNIFVIQLRNGKIHKTFQGGTITFLPVIDELITIPLQEQQTNVEIRTTNISAEKRFKIEGIINWFVKDPVNSFSNVEWDPENPNYAENIIKDITKTKLQLNCLDQTYDYVIGNQEQFISDTLIQISEFLTPFSLGVNSISITKIEKI